MQAPQPTSITAPLQYPARHDTMASYRSWRFGGTPSGCGTGGEPWHRGWRYDEQAQRRSCRSRWRKEAPGATSEGLFVPAAPPLNYASTRITKVSATTPS